MRIHLLFVVGSLVGLLSCSQGPAGPPGPAGAGGGDGVNGEGGVGPDAGAPIAATNGKRLTTKKSSTTSTTITSDGAKEVTSYTTSYWFDTQRKEACSFARSSDGKTRCLPVPLGVQASGGTYSDSACTQDLFATSKGSVPCGGNSSTFDPPLPPPKYILFSSGSSTCGGTGVRPIGAAIATPTTVYFKSGTNCVATPGQPGSYDYFEAGGDEIAPTDFVEVITTTVTKQ